MGDLSIKLTETMFFLSYIIISLKASIYDIKYRLVKNDTYISLIFLAVFNEMHLLCMMKNKEVDLYLRVKEHLINMAVIISVTLAILMFAAFTDAMGGGDVKYIFCNALILVPEKGMDVFLIWFTLIFVLMFLYQIIIKFILNKKGNKKGIPMVPFIAVSGSMTTIILNFIPKL